MTDAGHGILVDAAAAPRTYLDALQRENAVLTHILLTHGHYDHVGAVAALREQTGCKVYMDPADAAGSQMLPLSRGLVDENWPEGDELTIDELTFRVYHTPGHTPGSVCLQCGGLLFSGDTLFAGSCGRTDLPAAVWRRCRKACPCWRRCRWRTRPRSCPGTRRSRPLAGSAAATPV